MLSVKEALEMLGNVGNLPRVQELENLIHRLQNENLEMNTKLKDVEAQLKVNKEWEKTKESYQKFKTPNGSVVYVFTEEIIANIFYCPACFEKHKTRFPLQPLDAETQGKHQIGSQLVGQFKKCPSCKTVYNIGDDAHYVPPKLIGYKPE